MSELDAKELYYWSKIRQALKRGLVYVAKDWLMEASTISSNLNISGRWGLYDRLVHRIGDTFTAGCEAVEDPAPPKGDDHE